MCINCNHMEKDANKMKKLAQKSRIDFSIRIGLRNYYEDRIKRYENLLSYCCFDKEKDYYRNILYLEYISLLGIINSR